MKKFFSFSGGVESRVMALLFGHHAKGIFADTGAEHEVMYREIDIIEAWFKDRHGGQFEIIRVSRPDGESLPEYMKRYKYAPSFRNRFCTRRFKIEPIDAFLKDQGPCQLMIGLNADEIDRPGNLMKLENVDYVYPLQDLGIGREKCEALLTEFGIMPQFPVYMQRGGCKMCFFKSKKEFAALACLNPDEAYEVADLEEAIQDNRERYYSIRDTIPNMRKFVDAQQDLLFDPSEIYPESGMSHSPCGVFCHR